MRGGRGPSACEPERERPPELSLKANTLWNGAGSVFYLGCQWLTTVFVVVFSSGFSDSGALAYAMSIGIAFASIGEYKARTYQVSDVKGLFTQQNYIGFRIVTTIVAALIMVPYLLITTPDGPMRTATLIYLAFKADEVFVGVLYGIDQCHMRMDYIGKSQLIRGVVSLAGFSVPMLVWHSLYAAIACMALGCMAVTVLFDVRMSGRLESIRASIDARRALALAKACFFPMASNLFACAVSPICRQLFGLSYGEEALGIYASIATPAVLVQVAAVYLYAPMIGIMAKSLESGSYKEFLAKVRKAIVFMALAAGAAIGLLCLVGRPLLGLVFGQRVIEHYDVFPLALVATACIAFLLFFNDVLTIMRNRAVLLVGNVIAFAVAAATCLPFAAFLGMNGVNASIIAGSVFAIIIEATFVFIVAVRKGRFEPPVLGEDA